MIKSRTKTCGGTYVTSVILPKALHSNMLPSLNALGFIINERLLAHGLLSLENENVIINGTLNNKTISLYCQSALSEEDCNKHIEKVLSDIEKIVKQ